MSSVWKKLFANRPAPAKDAEQSPFRDDAHRETTWSSSSASGGQTTPKSQKVARTFDAIGRRNEDLRAQLDAVEFSFRNIEAIRARFHETLIPIDQTLAEIERTKIAHVEAERKFEALTVEHGRVKGDYAALALERSALIVKQDDLTARIGDLERAVTTSEAASSEALATLAERTAKLEGIEREFEDNRLRLQMASEQLSALRAEFAAKEKRLQEVEQQLASLNDQHDLLTQENRSLKTRNDEFVANVSKLNRQLDELESRREDANRRLEEFEVALSQEKTTHAKLKAALLDAEEAHRISDIKLKEELGVMGARSEAAERLLSEARAALRDREAASRGFEQRALESSHAAQSKESALADLAKDLNALRATHGEVDAARLAATERSTVLAKTLEDRDVTLQRAERKIEALEAKLAEQQKDALGERGLFEEKIAKLRQQFEAEAAARAFAEGALQSARQERGARQEAEAGSNAEDAPAAQVGPLRDGALRSDNDNRGTTRLELAFAWGFVGIPLLWGIYGTLANAMKLFQ
jgi:chromosome segregation ATPase